jgi:photosystem II stability/assembly factor-like uncharacterized protein
MVRPFSLASLFLAVVASVVRIAGAAESSGCATAEFRPSTEAEFRDRVQRAYEERAKKGHSLSNGAYAQAAPAPTFTNLDVVRKYMEGIDDTLRSMSSSERETALRRVQELVEKIAPKKILDYEFLHAIQFSGRSLGWALDWNGTLERTVDGGVNWSNARVAFPGLLQQFIEPDAGIFRNMHFADADFGLIVGLGPVYLSKDSGQTWNKAKPPSLLPNYNAVFCGPTKICWIAGADHAVYRGDPSKSSWTLQKTPAEGRVLAIQFIGANGWAVTNYGEIVGTTDGGDHWAKLYLDGGKSFRALNFIDNLQGWVVGARGVILRTHDGGKTWVEQTIQTPPGFPIDELRLEAVKFTNGKRGWAAGMNGIIFATTDGGECWTVQRFEGISHTLSIYSLAITEGPTVWAAGNMGNIFVSTDGGASWFPVHGMMLDIAHEIKRVLDDRAKP